MEAQFVANSWSYPSGRISQITTDYSASQERRSKRISGSLMMDEDLGEAAMSFFDSLSINTIAWGDHKAVMVVDASDPEDPEFGWEDSFPLETGFYFEH